jgi:hypothetical protein
MGWEKGRSDRARALAGDTELRHIASLINKLVDLESWDEDQEQELFEHAVSQCLEEMSRVLPPPFHDLVHTRVGCLEKETTDLLASNLLHACRDSCSFPFLDEQDKRRIIRAVVMIILETMKEGKDLVSFTHGMQYDPKAQDIIVEVFIEGAMDVFFDDEMRKELVQDVTGYIADVPFVPHGVIEKIAEAILKSFSGILHDALKEAFTIFKEACAKHEKLPVLPAPLDDESAECKRVEELWKDKPFIVQLRRIFIVKLLEKEKEVVGKNQIARIFTLIPRRTQAYMLGRTVDLMFENLPGLEKIEDTIQPFHSDKLHSHHATREVDDQLATQPSPDASSEHNKAALLPGITPQIELCRPEFITLEQPYGFSTNEAFTCAQSLPVMVPRTTPRSQDNTSPTTLNGDALSLSGRLQSEVNPGVALKRKAKKSKGDVCSTVGDTDARHQTLSFSNRTHVDQAWAGA